jgi:hypothetical protein
MEKVYKEKDITIVQLRRLTVLKTIVMRRIIEIRLKKSMPKLTDLIKKYIPQEKEDP